MFKENEELSSRLNKKLNFFLEWKKYLECYSLLATLPIIIRFAFSQ